MSIDEMNHQSAGTVAELSCNSFDLAQLQPFEEYRKARQHLLPSKGAGEWYCRTHRLELVKAGALLIVRGQWYCDPAAFDSVFRAVAQRQALSQLSASDYAAHAGA